MGLFKWAGKRAGKRAKRNLEKRREGYDQDPARIHFTRDGTRMRRMPNTPLKPGTGTGYKKTVAVAKVAPAGLIVAINAGIGFLRGIKPELVWDESQDANFIALMAGIWGVGVGAWDWKRAYWDKRKG